MSISHSRTCRECGARLPEDAAVCDLCGASVEAAPATTPAAARADETPATPALLRAGALAGPSGVHCNQCGWRNPPDARFCSMCGTRLQDLSTASAEVEPEVPFAAPPVGVPGVPPAEDAAGAGAQAAKQEQRALSRQVGIIVGAGVLLVVVLFLVTVVSKNQPGASAGTAIEATTTPPLNPDALPPLPSPLAEQVASLEDEIAGLAGEAKAARQRELVGLLYSAGRLDRAALEQQRIAEAQDSPEDWKRAGDLLYDWMITLDDQRKPQVAQQAVAAYQRVLATDPDNLDVRTDMATAYLNSNNPMQGVQEIKRVLEADPNHLHALFNYGIMLSMIGRRDQAVEQFEKVKTLVEKDSRYYQQAEEAIEAIRSGGTI